MDIDWDGFHNIRDLGNADELYARAGPRSGAQFPAPSAGPATPAGMRWSHVALEDPEDVAFWRPLNDAGLNATPLDYGPFLRAKPNRCAAVVTAVARAERGTTARDAIVELMAGFDAEAYLLAAGVTSADLAALRARIVEDPVTGRTGRTPPGTGRRSSG